LIFHHVLTLRQIRTRKGSSEGISRKHGRRVARNFHDVGNNPNKATCVTPRAHPHGHHHTQSSHVGVGVLVPRRTTHTLSRRGGKARARERNKACKESQPTLYSIWHPRQPSSRPLAQWRDARPCAPDAPRGARTRARTLPGPTPAAAPRRSSCARGPPASPCRKRASCYPRQGVGTFPLVIFARRAE
jgi:hypothetical protein